jgi:hypothetical protein
MIAVQYKVAVAVKVWHGVVREGITLEIKELRLY